MERKKLLDTQRELLLQKFQILQQAQASFNDTLRKISIELAIPEKEINDWRISKDAMYFEKTKPMKIIPKGKKK